MHWEQCEWYTSWTQESLPWHSQSWYLASIPLRCHGVPMATYIYLTGLGESADLSLVAAVDLGGMHAVIQRKRGRNEREQNPGGVQKGSGATALSGVYFNVSIGDMWAHQNICLQLLGTANSTNALLLILPTMWFIKVAQWQWQSDPLYPHRGGPAQSCWVHPSTLRVLT